jgi:hypothetical protein
LWAFPWLTAVVQTISARIKDKPGAVVTCPTAGCRAKLEFADVARVVPEAVSRTYNQQLCHLEMEKWDDFFWCSKPNCGWGQLVDQTDGAADFFRCRSCATLTCLRHRLEFHAGLTCAQYDLARTDDGTRDEIARSTKACPKCKKLWGFPVNCSHVTCDREFGGCGFEWCWWCQASFLRIRDVGNDAHEAGCRYHTSNL